MYIKENLRCILSIKIIFFFITIYFLNTNCVYSQQNNYKFQHFTTKDGLPHSIIGCIYQDNKGFLWFGTANGLVKYDGYKFIVYQSILNDTNSLSNNQVHKIAGDNDGNLWLATSKGINKFSPETGKFKQYVHNPNNPNSLFSDEIYNIFFDKAQNLLIYSNGDVFQALDIKNNKFININNLLSGKINFKKTNLSFLSNDNKGNIWFSNNFIIEKQFYSNLYKFSLENKSIFEYPDAKLSLKLKKNEQHTMTALIGDKSDTNIIWIANNQGLIKLNKSSGLQLLYRYTDKSSKIPLTLSVTDLFFEKKERIWVSTMNEGLFIFNSISGKFESHFKHDINENSSLSNDNVQTSFKDKANNIWVLTLGGGLNKVCFEKKQFITYCLKENKSNGTSEKDIWSLWEDPVGIIWIGTGTKGIDLLNRNSADIIHLQHIHGLNNNLGFSPTGSICEDNIGNIWAITWDGNLYCINKKNGKVRIYKGGNNDLIGWSFRCMIPYKGNYLIIGSFDSGLEIFDISKQKSARIKDIDGRLYNNPIYSIHQGKSGKIWCGSAKGLVQLNPETGESKIYGYSPQDIKSIQCKALTAIYEENDSIIWVGSEGCGLYRLNSRNGKLTNFTLSNGLPSNNIFGIYMDKHSNLWLSTGHGISMFSVGSGRFRNYNLSDGIQSNEFYWGSHFQNKKGEIFFGGSNGFTVFCPDSIKDNPFTPNTVLTEFRVANKIVNPGDTINRHILLHKGIEFTKEINLTYKESDIYFEFAGLHFTAPEKMQYSYKMEGFDKDWKITDASKRFAQYTNLDAGDYTFRVKSTNNDGIYCKPENEVALKITISPPFWKTWWFRFALILLIVGSLFAYYFQRIKHIRMRNLILEKTVKLRTIEIEKQKEKLQTQAEHLMESNVLLEEKQQELQFQKDEIFNKNVVLERQKREIIDQRDKVYDMAVKIEAVNVMKMNFFSNISHEFRTPLTLIIDPLEKMIQDDSFDKKKKEDVKTIKRSAFRLLHLVEQLTDIQKIETTNMKLQVSYSDIIPFLRDIYQAFRPFAENHNIRFNFETSINCAQIYFDADKIEKILYNLLSNAFKFTNENGTISISIIENIAPLALEDNILNEPSDNAEITCKYLQIAISDTGSGIAKDKIPYIFDRYYHIDSPVEHVQKGTGIGLSLTKDLVELHKGILQVSSEEAKGTVFTLSIPYGRGHLNDNDIVDKIPGLNSNKISLLSSMATEQETRKEDDSETKNEKGLNQNNDLRPFILLVEDDKDVMYYLRSNLEHLFQISEATNGSEGYKKAKEQIPDMIISDVMMPEMDGFELCQEIKSNENTYFIPFILLTARNDEDSKLAGIEAGADDFFTKPFSSKTLIARIKNLFENRKRLKESFSKEPLPVEQEIIISANDGFLNKAETVVEQNMENCDFDAEMFSIKIGMSYSTLYRKIKELTGLSINVYIRSIRLKKASILLKQDNKNVSEVAFAVGFKTANYFTHVFKECYGISPSEYTAK